MKRRSYLLTEVVSLVKTEAGNSNLVTLPNSNLNQVGSDIRTYQNKSKFISDFAHNRCGESPENT